MSDNTGAKVRFRVSRTSQWSDDESPCPEAARGTYTEHVYCTLSLTEAMKSPLTQWFRELTNHRKAPGGSVADRLNKPCWFVDLSMTDLEAFCKKYGDAVVGWGSDGPHLEIYDGCRE